MAVKNCKAKGTRAEHRTMKYLSPLGYRCCRSAASLGEWDVIAVGADDVRLIQVKCNRWVSGVELETLKEFKCPPGVIKEMWRWDDRVREPRVRRID